LWLVSGQTLYTDCNSIYDEQLFLNLAGSLLNGQWLDPYNQSTLIKGMFYPLWIAAMHAFGVPPSAVTAPPLYRILFCAHGCHGATCASSGCFRSPLHHLAV
jgi:hypothetical protein